MLVKALCYVKWNTHRSGKASLTLILSLSPTLSLILSLTLSLILSLILSLSLYFLLLQASLLYCFSSSYR